MVQLIRHKLSHRLARGLAGVGLLLVALVLLSDRADGAQAITAGISPLYYFGMHRESVEDMRVKVLGGHIRVTRNWDANKWYINRQWDPLKDAGGSYRLSTGSGGTSTGGTSPGGGTIGETPPGPWQLDRAGQRYRWVSGNTYVHSANPRLTITKTDTGWRWQNRQGHWMDYDEDRKAIAYGDRNNVRVSLSYDGDDRLSGVFDHLGKQILWVEYNTDNLVSAIRDYTLRRVEYHYTTKQLTQVIDVRGHAWGYTYEGTTLKTKTDPEGRITTIDYAGDIVAGIFDQNGIGAHYKYEYDKTKREYYVQVRNTIGKILESWLDSEGDLVRQDVNGKTINTIQKDGRNRTKTDSLGNRTVKEYDEWKNLTKITYPDGATITYKYDLVYSNILEKTNENGVTTKYEYDPNGNLIKMTKALGRPEQRITEYEYDAYGNRANIKHLGNAVTETAETAYTFDPFGNVASVRDPENKITEYKHDVSGNMVLRTDAKGSLWKYAYDADGRLVSATNPLDNTVRYEYDKMGNRIKINDPYNQTTTTLYDQYNNITEEINTLNESKFSEYSVDGLLLKVIDEEGRTVRFDYDNFGRKIKRIDGNGNIIQWIYDDTDHIGASGRRAIKAIFPTYVEEYKYDKRDRLVALIKVTSSTTTILRYEYDGVGNRIAVDSNGKITRYEYDALNRQIKIIDPAGGVTRKMYDNRNNLITFIDPNNQIYRSEYDRNNNKIKDNTPMGQITMYAFDELGNLTEKVDAKNQKVKYKYNPIGSIIETQYFSSTDHVTPVKTVTYSYNKLGNLVSYDDGSTSATYVYDPLQRKQSETVNYGSFSLTYAYTYCANGSKKTYTDPEGVKYEYTFGSNDEIVSAKIPGAGTVTYSGYKWNSPGKITFPGGSTQVLGYDELMRVSSINSFDPGNNAILDYQYDYDVAGRVRTVVSGHGVYNYTYDDVDRLTGVALSSGLSESYSYDAVGNRLTDNSMPDEWTYNSNNQLLQAGNTSYEYDNNGNTTKKFNSATTVKYVYNVENRLEQIKSASDVLIARYYYDPFGRRLWKEASGLRTYFFYTDEGLAGEYDNTGSLIKGYNYVPGGLWGTNPLLMKYQGEYYFYLNDHLGTPQKLISRSGKELWSATYDAFGRRQSGLELVQNNLRFAGQYYDDESGLHYNYFRYYDPDTGRYFRKDPAGLHAGLNPYLYVLANPLRWIDPFGLEQKDPILTCPCIAEGEKQSEKTGRVETFYGTPWETWVVVNLPDGGWVREKRYAQWKTRKRLYKTYREGTKYCYKWTYKCGHWDYEFVGSYSARCEEKDEWKIEDRELIISEAPLEKRDPDGFEPDDLPNDDDGPPPQDWPPIVIPPPGGPSCGGPGCHITVQPVQP